MVEMTHISSRDFVDYQLYRDVVKRVANPALPEQNSSRPRKVMVSLSMDQILTLDVEYRQKVESGELPWVHGLSDGNRSPIMQKVVDGTQVMVFYASVKARDGVVICQKTQVGEIARCTVSTEWRDGPLRGRRVVWGRAEECEAYHDNQALKWLIDRSMDILKTQLGFSDVQAHRAIYGQASGRGIFLFDVALIIVEAGEIKGRYPQIFDEVQFDFSSWCTRRHEVLAKLCVMEQSNGGKRNARFVDR